MKINKYVNYNYTGHFSDEGPLNDAFEFLSFSALH